MDAFCLLHLFSNDLRALDFIANLVSGRDCMRAFHTRRNVGQTRTRTFEPWDSSTGACIMKLWDGPSERPKMAHSGK